MVIQIGRIHFAAGRGGKSAMRPFSQNSLTTCNILCPTRYGRNWLFSAFIELRSSLQRHIKLSVSLFCAIYPRSLILRNKSNFFDALALYPELLDISIGSLASLNNTWLYEKYNEEDCTQSAFQHGPIGTILSKPNYLPHSYSI